ncbi:MAG: alpha/beta fold hydrolase [Ilumatobacteraceae bacterium]
MKRVIRLVVLIAAAALLVRILVNEDRNNWFALIPGALLALAVGHRIATVVSRRRIATRLAEPRPTRPAADFTPDSELYPYESQWFESSVGRIHYLDEGQGRPLLLMHGNPDWSFLYRKMIPLLRDDFRCISIDYPGFGLSDHPNHYGYRPQDHGRVVSELVEHLDLQDAVMVGQDWGGPIGMDVASRDPDRFTGLVFGNTFFFPALRLQRMFGTVMTSDIMRHQVMKRSLFVRRMLPALLRATPTATELAHYDEVAPTYASRIGHATFLASITGERDWLADLERRVDTTLLDKPMLRILGYKDKPLTTREFLAKWDEKYPNATTLDLPDAGHFWQDDAPDAAATAIRDAFASAELGAVQH